MSLVKHGPDRRRIAAAVLAASLLSLGALMAGPARTSGAQGTPPGPAVAGEAFGYYTKVGLFGGPQRQVGPKPFVTLPSNGSPQPLTADETQGASVFGPAHIFAGMWPCDPDNCPKIAPASGPIEVSTQGTPGPGGSVTSTVRIMKHPEPLKVACDDDPPGATNCTSLGGFGPIPVTQGEEMHTTCTANESGVSGSVRLVNAELAPATDPSGEPINVEKLPENPPPNFEKTGEITNVGDRWRIIYNEQIIEPDGSITVNGYHMHLLGAIAVGEQIVGHVRCSPTGSPSTTPTAPPTTAPAPAPSAAERSAAERAAVPTGDEGGSDPLPFILIGVGVVAAIGLVMLLMSRRSAKHEPPASR